MREIWARQIGDCRVTMLKAATRSRAKSTANMRASQRQKDGERNLKVC